MRRSFAVLAALLALLAASFTPVTAQDASPAAGPAPGQPTGGLPVVASGLTNPRGFTWGPDGTFYVALAGSGGTNRATEDSPANQAIGPFQGGATAAVARIEDGCPSAVVTGLPSVRDGLGGVLGAEDIAFLGEDMYVAVDGGGAAHGNPDQPAGVYRVSDDGTFEVVADLSAWVRANPVAEVPGDYDPDAEAYRMVANEEAGNLWLLGPNSGQVLTVSPDGAITRVADLSAGHPVPSAMAAAPEGGVYVGNLTPVPFADGAAKVVHVAEDGTVRDVWTGLTAVTDIVVGSDGTLYALELSTGNLPQPPFLVPGGGRIVRQTGPDTLEVVAGGLVFPIALDFGPEGSLYVALPALGADRGEGVIARLDLAGATGSPAAGTPAEAPICTPIPETTAPPHADATPGPATPIDGTPAT